MFLVRLLILIHENRIPCHNNTKKLIIMFRWMMHKETCLFILTKDDPLLSIVDLLQKLHHCKN